MDWLDRHAWIPGAALPLSFLFAEGAPLARTVGEAPAFFSIHFFLMLAPWARPLPSWTLLIPAALLFALSLAPLRGRGFRWEPFLLVLAGLSFFPILVFGPFGQESGPLWSILFLAFAGLNLWVRRLDYFYAGAIAALLWDCGAGVRGLMLGLRFIPEPYWNATPPCWVCALDLSLAAAMAALWRRRVDFGKLTGWRWLEAVD